MNSRRRVVITGLGAFTPLGLSMRTTWTAALEGRSGIGAITHFDVTDCPVKFAGEVKGYDPSAPVGPLYPRGTAHEPLTCAIPVKDVKKMGRFCHLGISAGIEAYADSGLDAFRTEIAPERLGVNIGVGMGGLPEIEAVHTTMVEKGFKRITPFFIPQAIPNMPAGHLSILLDLRGPNLCNLTACASSAHSIGEATHQIQRGDADVMLAGGAESVICGLAVGGFAAMRALSTRNDSPQTASRPFDRGRDGFVMGEGAAVLVLEEYEFARARGARIYAEVLGYGLSSDAYHMTLPAPEGEGGYRAMKMAIERAGIHPDRIGYVNAHGTSTPAGDAQEILAISRVLPNGAKNTHVSSTKSMTGHLLGAAGALEAAFCALSIHESRIPPTINLDDVDPECAAPGMNLTPHHRVEKKLDCVLSNSFGFGGTNASLVLGRLNP